jgi:hypothetical protein
MSEEFVISLLITLNVDLHILEAIGFKMMTVETAMKLWLSRKDTDVY